MPTFAAVDIGANSVRLKVARLKLGRLQTLAEDREVTRLGESVFRHGALSGDAMEHAIKVLKRFHKTTQKHGAISVRVVATSAVRDARNAPMFVDWVQAATGWHLEVISGLEEGRLIHLAVISGMRNVANSRALLFDLGGGSCEITVSDAAAIRYMVSLPLGAVRLTREFLLHDPPRQDEFRRLRMFVAEEISRVESHLREIKLQQAVGTSGTAAALAGVWTARQESRPTTVPARAVSQLAEELATHTTAERANIPGIGTRRAEIIVAGAAVFAELLRRTKLPSFRYSPLGLRDGLLAQMAAEFDHRTRFQRQVESERSTALMGMCRQYDVDTIFARRVSELALQLFDGLKRVHALPPDYRDWLAAAAMLHEVGTYVNRAARHRHAYYLISNSELFGYTAQMRNIIAAIARYVGRSRPSPESRPMRVLSMADQINVRKAVVLLRVARALDQGRRGAVKSLAIQLQPGRVQLSVTAKPGGADLELWALRKESAYFREVFGRELFAATS